MIMEDKIIKLPRVKKPSKRVAKVLEKWKNDHQSEKWKKVILIAQRSDGTICVADSGFKPHEEALFRGMVDYVKDSWSWGSDDGE